ncbi:D-mannonate dehydratase ManD [Streptomyces mangrovisoli]|uniref:Bifunctional D-altronate/D-mannonate dehydratase n=1 Tax=Streptomyces mangrovisoli TaxID=1428628 RepID=A0A1J4NLW6_9ACTN|nr:D-mannonate dehydratase ManD [Streptomyces mangrovisoli]OIJ62612.1 bifunctional D-altronate/D-mannonate dehydratase [Streptomyces mangrovisoli]
MKIVSAEVIVTSPGRNFVTLRLTTEDGVVGLGDATLNGRELAVESYLDHHLVPLLIGSDASRIEDTWQQLYRGAYWRRGPVTMAAIAAVDTALWDIKAKCAGMPLYQLLGGASRIGALAYGHASGRDIPELLDSIREHLAQGYRAIRVQSGIPGFESVYGVAASGGGDRYDYEPARPTSDDRPRPTVETWDTRAYLRHLPTVFEAVRAEFGPELPLLHDGHHRMRPIEAARLGKSLEPYDLFWLEDATPAEDPSALRWIRHHTTTPLAIGEVFNSIHDYVPLLSERLIDYVRSAVTHTGGVTGMKKLLDLAALHGVKSGMHGPTDISPVGMAAALHLDLAVHNFGIQEYMRHSARTLEVFRTSYRFEDGLLHPSDTPGLGVDLDVAAARRFPYRQAYLPVARLRDGTVHDW